MRSLSCHGDLGTKPKGRALFCRRFQALSFAGNRSTSLRPTKLILIPNRSRSLPHFRSLSCPVITFTTPSPDGYQLHRLLTCGSLLPSPSFLTACQRARHSFQQLDSYSTRRTRRPVPISSSRHSFAHLVPVPTKNQSIHYDLPAAHFLALGNLEHFLSTYKADSGQHLPPHLSLPLAQDQHFVV